MRRFSLARLPIHRIVASLVALTATVTLSILPNYSAQAANSGDFNPGNIISDAIFFNSGTMGTTDIQNFLNAKMPGCLPMSQPAQYASQRRACLRDYAEAPSDAEVSLVKALYQDIHGRSPEAGGLSTWVTALKSGQPVSYAVNGVLASDEYYNARIVATYRQVLNRDPEPSGQGYWLTEIQTSRLKVDDLAMIHTASDEYFNYRAGGNPATFVSNLYQTLLGRSASAGEVSNWVGVLNSSGRRAVIDGIYNSNESAARRINALYRSYFQRDADPSGIITYTPWVLGPGRDQALRGLLVNSPEYLSNAIARYSGAMITSDRYCNGYTSDGLESAATIIRKVAVSCGINPRALLVLLEKESGLVTDTWPLQWQYRSATGMGCPDTADCNPEYGGFLKQVYYGARSFKYYVANPTRYSYQGWGRTANVLYNPNANCGTRSIYIENSATFALYTYTPYTPNSAALSNLYGTGDSCSAYGNRNFWRLFTDWFGATH